MRAPSKPPMRTSGRSRLDPPEQASGGEDALAACNRTIDSVRCKADRNQRLARISTTMIILTSALIPLSIIISTQGGEFAWGKLIPSILAAAAATSAGVLQFERPHERWKLYRGYQRAFEAERFRYENEVLPYDGAEPGRTRAFAATIAQLQLHLHEEWSGLVPASAQVAARAIAPASAEARAPADAGAA
jgi:Protein of unknown function (DUF4231)